MNEQIEMLQAQARMVWMYRWYALLIAAVISLIGWTYVLRMPNTYEVSAKIFIDTRSMLKPLLRGLTVDNRMLENTALLMKRTLLTRPNLEEVARRTDMDLKTTTPEDYERLITKLAEKINVAGGNRDNIYEIKYESLEPQQAKKVVEELLNTFMEKALGETRKDTAVTQKFLDEQIADYEKKLLESEERLKEFKRKNVGMMPGSGSDYYSRMQQAQSQLSQAELDLNEATRRRNEIKRQLVGEEPVFGIITTSPVPQMSSPELAQINERLRSMQEQLDQLLLRYTERHPDIGSIKVTMESLEKRKKILEDELKELVPVNAGPDPIDTNPVYQEMKIGMGRAEAEIAALSARVQEFRKRAEGLKSLVDTVPQVEAELKRLDRDYGINKQNYDSLVQRRESARLSEEAEQTEDIKLNVIEPPRIPLFPTGPKRMRLLSMVFLMSLGVGGGFAWLLSQLKPRIFTSAELKELVGVPVIGTVSMVQNQLRSAERRMELASFIMVFLILAGVYSALVSLQIMNIDVNTYITRFSGGLL